MANIDLTQYGITGTTEIVHNPSYEMLFEEETNPNLEGFDKGQESELGAVNVMTGIYTGRSPKDKYIVMDENSKDTVWWTSDEYPNDNHPASQEAWDAVKDIAKNELSNKRLFVVDAFCGANKDTRMAIRFIVEVAWQAHFVTNMFIRPTAEELENFEPDFVVYNASKAKVENYKELGLRSETAVMFNITSREQVIVNTWYGGEMKKGMFSMMNYYLPLKGIASMHCSANTDMNGENTAIFFGLSGTGKTTLSTDPKRLLIGDDEHGWDDNGVFNFEGGCYAKVIDLDKDSEPDIYNAIKRNALLENVTLDAEGHIDFTDKSVTENTRVSYPIDHIEKIVRPVSAAPAAKNVIFLSADAFGVLPPAKGHRLVLYLQPGYQLYPPGPDCQRCAVEGSHRVWRIGHHHQPVQAGEGPQGHCGGPESARLRLSPVSAVRGERGVCRPGEPPRQTEPPGCPHFHQRLSLVFAVLSLCVL